MDLGVSTFAEVPLATSVAPVGITIIPEVAQLTRELVLVVEIDLIQPKAGAEEEA